VTILRFTVRGPQVSTNEGYIHAIHRGRPSTRLSEKAALFKAMVANAARKAHRSAGAPPPIEQGAVVGIRFVFPTLGSDIDGPSKFVIDGLAGGSPSYPGARLVVNDNRVRRLFVEKPDPDGSPRTEVAVATTDEPGCPRCGCLCRSLLP
jgi:hypothetical protein